ncbi:MAG: hypothetical protein QG635_2183, partial [Bacteroidota bacterium]|nr:hypothetical protein [Bacteroidota bacterium]
SNSIVAKTQYIRYIGDTSREIDNISVAANVNIFLIGLSVLF